MKSTLTYVSPVVVRCCSMLLLADEQSLSAGQRQTLEVLHCSTGRALTKCCLA